MPMLRTMERPTKATLRPCWWAASRTCWMRCTWLAKLETMTRPGQVRNTVSMAGVSSRSEVVNPGTSALVESTRNRSTPSAATRANEPRSVRRPSRGNWSILKSPVCSTSPAGVRIATARPSGIEWLTAMNSQSNGPSFCRCPSATSTVLGMMRCSLSLAFILAKLKEHRIIPKTVEVAEGQRQKLGPFDCEFIAVNHSIPDGLAVAIRTPAGLVLHTGDFKMDQFPLDGRLTDLGSFARVAAEGVDLFLVDSTNADVPGFTTSERELTPAIETVFRTCPGRVIVSSFASHVHRIQQVLDAAHQHGRKVAFVGRSMVRNMGIARDLGYLTIPKGLVIDLKALNNLPANKITLICTGSQGEPM